MKERFLNQKLGKRTSRKAGLQKAQVLAANISRAPRAGVPGRNFPSGKPI